MMYDAVHVVLQAMVVYLLQRPGNATVTLQTAAQKEDVNIRKALIWNAKKEKREKGTRNPSIDTRTHSIDSDDWIGGSCNSKHHEMTVAMVIVTVNF